MAYSVQDIANKILSRATSEKSLICNMKLQKMLYYMQGFFLAYFDKPLFDEDIEAWHYGPVVPSMYKECKSHKNLGIPYEGKVVTLDRVSEGFFNELYRICNKNTAIDLMTLTHSEDPWKSTFGKKSVIKKSLLKKFFKKVLEEIEFEENIQACREAKDFFEKKTKGYTLEEVERRLGYVAI